MEKIGLSKNKKKINIFIHCGSGYVFNEIFLPVIEALGKEVEIYALFRSFGLSEQNKKNIERLFESKKIVFYEIMDDYNDFEGKFKVHVYLWKFIKHIRQIKFNLFILGDDVMLFERYLIYLTRKQKSRVVILQTSLAYKYLEKYLGKKTKNYTQQKRITGYYNKISQSFGLIKKLKIVMNSLLKRLEIVINKIRAFKNHYFYPFLFTKTFFVWEKTDSLGMTSGRADAFVSYDPLDYQAIKSSIPGIRNMFLARHPLQGTCKCATRKNINPKKLLAMFGGPWEKKLSEEVLNRWMQTLRRAVNFLQIDEICLRFHPMTSRDNPQTIQLLEESKKIIKNFTIIDSLSVPLSDDVCNYECIIGAPSTSLKIARTVCERVPVIGLLNSGNSTELDNNWMFGSMEGVNWILENEELEKKHFTVSKSFEAKRPSVVEILRNQLAQSL